MVLPVLDPDTSSTGDSTGRGQTEDNAEDRDQSSKISSGMTGMLPSIKIEVEEETTPTGSSKEGHSGHGQLSPEVRTTQRKKTVGESKAVAGSSEIWGSNTDSTSVSTGRGRPGVTSEEEGGRSSKTDFGTSGMELESLIKVEVVKGASGRSEVMDSDIVSASASLSTGSRQEEEAIEQRGRSPKRNLGLPGMVPSVKVEAVDEGATGSSGVLTSDTVSTGVSKGRAHTEDIAIVGSRGLSSKAHLRMTGMLSSSSIKAEEETTGSTEGHSGRDQRRTEVRTTQREKKVGRSNNTASSGVSESETLSTTGYSGCGGPDHTLGEGGRSSKTDLGMSGMVPSIKVEDVEGATGRSEVVDSNTVSTNVSIARRHEEEKVEESGRNPKRKLGNESVHTAGEKLPPNRKHFCSHCGKSFPSAKDLNRHLTVHTGERRFACHNCTKKFSQRSHLNVHMRTHTQEKSFTCNICDKTFISLAVLNDHTRTHTKERPFSCVMCGKGFALHSTLMKHIRVHTQERPYCCRNCKKEFNSISNLTGHYRIHTQERPFKCELCRKGFLQSNHLNKHMRTHTKEKPYNCSQCNKAFGYQHSLTNHLKKVHSNST